MRLFTALEFPPGVHAHLTNVVEKLCAVPALKDMATFTKPENLHVTLKFLGDVDDKYLPNLTRALQIIPFPPMTFSIPHFLVLPGHGPARVLAGALIGDNKPLLTLFEQLEATVQPLGVRRESRTFKPHVTFFRIKRPSRHTTARTLGRLVDPGLLPTPEFTVTQATLFQSTLTPAGPIYAPVAHFPANPQTPGIKTASPLPSDRARS
jgi:2'-5' RNA ligase